MATRKVNTQEVKVDTEDTNEEKIIVEEKKPRVFEKEDLIPCRSLCNGELLIVGNKSDVLYRWADFNTVEDVEFQDLQDMVIRKTPAVQQPRIIIEDEDFLDAYPKYRDLYNSLYSPSDLAEILDLPAFQMKNVIESLPAGVKENLKGVASSMIENHQLDSVEKIKVIDSIFDTKLLITLAQY